MEDIAPGLLEKIRALFLELLGDDAPSANTYTAAGDYAERVGDALATTFQRCLSGDVLPDGKMYWNIADRVVRPLLEEDWRLCTGAAAEVQRALNKAAGIGLAAQIPDLDKSRIDGILNTLCATDRYEDEAGMLDEPVRTFSRAAVDETLRRNAEFHAKAGLRPRIVRTTEHGCCKWCMEKAGTYSYPDVSDDVYKRHANCRCSVEYDPGDSKRQDVWNKRWTDGQDRDILEARKSIGVNRLISLQPETLIKRASGQIGATDGNTVINSIEPFDFQNKQAIQKAIEIFLEQHSNSPEEHAIVISPNGHLYRLTGTVGTVNTALVGENALVGSIGAHNHPVWRDFDCGDSFSRRDIEFSLRHHTGAEYLTSGTRREVFAYTGELTPEQFMDAYNSAKKEAMEIAYESEKPTEFWQEEILKILAQNIEGIEYHDVV